MNKKKRKRKVRLLSILFILVICAILYFVLFRKTSETSDVLSEIKEYGYVTKKRDTEVFKNTFSELELVLKDDDVDLEKYAKLISELFIIDLYTINNKNSQYDIGGIDYIYPDGKESFKSKVQDTLYKYVQNIDDRKQDLPEVSSVKTNEVEASKFEYKEKEYDAYTVNISWDYKKDYGYDNKGVVTVIFDNNKLYIASYTPEVRQ